MAGDALFVEDLEAEAWLVASHSRLNVVPDRAVVLGEARFLRPAEGEGLARRLAALAAEIATATGTELDFAADTSIPPVDPDGPHRALAESAVELVARRGWRLVLDRERGGISCPNFLPDPGRIPSSTASVRWAAACTLARSSSTSPPSAARIVLLADLLAADAAGRR